MYIDLFFVIKIVSITHFHEKVFLVQTLCDKVDLWKWFFTGYLGFPPPVKLIVMIYLK